MAKNSSTGECRGERHGRLCPYHYNQYRSGVMDCNGNKLRDLTYGLKYAECIAKDAGTGVCHGKKTGRFCKKHYHQFEHGIIDTYGNKIRDFIKGGSVCQK